MVFKKIYLSLAIFNVFSIYSMDNFAHRSINESREELKTYPCENPGCKQQFKSTRDRNVHKRYCDKKDEKERTTIPNTRFKCNLCNYSTNALCNLTKHINNHPKADEKICTNSGCNRKFEAKNTLIKHKKLCDILTEEERKFEAEIFKKIQESTAAEKISQHFKCDFPDCSNSYSYETGLNAHKKIHKDKLDFRCDQCRFECNNNSALQTHTKRNHKKRKLETVSRILSRHTELNQNTVQQNLLSGRNYQQKNTEATEESPAKKMKTREISINTEEINQMDMDHKPDTPSIASFYSDLADLLYNKSEEFTPTNFEQISQNQNNDTQTEETSHSNFNTQKLNNSNLAISQEIYKTDIQSLPNISTSPLDTLNNLEPDTESDNYICINAGCNRQFKAQNILVEHKKHCDCKTEEERKFANIEQNNINQEIHEFLSSEVGINTLEKINFESLLELPGQKTVNSSSEKLKEYPCKNLGCIRKFNSNSALKQHKYYCDKENENERKILNGQLYICSKCDYNTSSLSDLSEHKKNMHWIPISYCTNPGCSRQFRTSPALINHKKSCDKKTEEQRKAEDEDLKRVNEYKARGLLKENNQKYKCDYPDCFNLYCNIPGILQHSKIHHGNLDFKCNLCRFACNNKAALETHNQTNHTKKRKLEVCDKKNEKTRTLEFEQAKSTEPNDMKTSNETISEPPLKKMKTLEKHEQTISDQPENYNDPMIIEPEVLEFESRDNCFEFPEVETKEINPADLVANNITDKLTVKQKTEEDLSQSSTKNILTQNKSTLNKINILENQESNKLEEQTLQCSQIKKTDTVNLKIASLKGLTLVLNNILKNEIDGKTNAAIKQSLIRIKNVFESHNVSEIIANSTEKQIVVIKLTLFQCIEKLQKVYTSLDDAYKLATEIKNLINSKISSIIMSD